MTHRRYKQAIQQLREQAIDVDGRSCVRAHVAATAAGVVPSVPAYWERRGWVERIERRVTRSRRNLRGIEVYYPLDQVIGILDRRATGRSWRAYSDRERRTIREMAGRYTWEEIGRRLGRPAGAVERAAWDMGVRVYQRMLERDRLIAAGQLARLLRHERSTIDRWRRQGMPVAFTRPDKRGQSMYRLGDVRQWLIGQPTKVVHLHPAVLKLLRIDLAELGDADDRRAA